MTPRSKYLTLFALAACIGWMAPGEASAEGKAKKTSKARVHKKAKPAKAELPKAKNYDFLADDIDGERVRPDDTTIFGIKNVKHTSLIRLREHFINEIVRSAEML